MSGSMPFTSVTVAIQKVEDIVAVRRESRHYAQKMGFGLADQTRLATAVSELARNALQYAGGGISEISDRSDGCLLILQVQVKDKGPGIVDIGLAMTDGYSSAKGLGAGLPGCQRLVDEFEIRSAPGNGTQVRIAIHANCY